MQMIPKPSLIIQYQVMRSFPWLLQVHPNNEKTEEKRNIRNNNKNFNKKDNKNSDSDDFLGFKALFYSSLISLGLVWLDNSRNIGKSSLDNIQNDNDLVSKQEATDSYFKKNVKTVF